MFFQATVLCRVGQSSVFQIGDHRAVPVHRCAKSRTHSKREHAGMVPVTGTVGLFGQRNGVGVVEHRKLTAVKRVQCRCDVHLRPRLTKIGGRDGSRMLHCTWKTKSDGAGPAFMLDSLLQRPKHIVRRG